MPHPRLASLARLVRHVRRDETGVISLLTVFVLLGLTMLLLAMINIAKQIDGKVRCQNAVDAATRSAASTVARGMNAVAFANHLEADVFAIASLLYALEGTDTPWTPQYAPLRPLFEQMLAERAVSTFRSEVILLTPRLASRTMREIARRHGLRQTALESEQQSGAAGTGTSSYATVLWGIKETDDEYPELPIDDLELVPSGRTAEAIQQRNQMARRNLRAWLGELGNALQARQLRMPTGLPQRARDRLDQLLDVEFPSTNIPALLAVDGENPQWMQFLGIVYGQHVSEMAPRMYRNPLRNTADAVAFAQARVFVPVRRYRWSVGRYVEDDGTVVESLGWITRRTEPNGTTSESDNYDNWPQAWDTFNQNWTAQLVPATWTSVPKMLSSSQGVRMPSLNGVPSEQFQLLNTH